MTVVTSPPALPPPPAVKGIATRAVSSLTARRSLAVMRLATGAAMWGVLADAAFGLGFRTPADRAWVSGSGPVQDVTGNEAVAAPLQRLLSVLTNSAGDVIVMAALLCIGAAVMLGVGLRISAVVGGGGMLATYLAEWSFVVNGTCVNPVVDHHALLATALIVIAVVDAGDTWGLGRRWKELRAVQRNHWLV